MTERYEPSDPLSMPFECFEYFSDRYPFPIEAHRHYFAEMILVRKGTALIRMDQDTKRLTEGMLCFIYPNLVHSIDKEGGDVQYDVIKLDVNQLNSIPSYAPPLGVQVKEAARQNMPCVFSAEAVERTGISHVIRRCLEQQQEQAYGYDMIIRSLLNIILTLIIREWVDLGFTIHHKALSSDLYNSIDSVTSYIEANLRSSLKVDQLAEYCCMSYPSFARKFRELYGISCKEYIQQVRVARVEHYLRFTDWELNFISQETGFTDCSHMIREFRRLKGTTPGQYRIKLRTD